MTKSAVGRYPAVVQEQAESLSVRGQDASTMADLTLTSASIVILSPEGGELVASTAASVSGAVATYSRTWGSSTFRRDLGYRAQWTLLTASSTVKREQYFQVVRRRFLSQLTDADLTDVHPYLATQLPAAGLKNHRLRAWDRITERAFQKIQKYPGNAFSPERFREAHFWLTLAEVFFALAFDGSETTEDVWKHKKAESRGLEELDAALSFVDFDGSDDGKLDASEQGLSFAQIRLVR